MRLRFSIVAAILMIAPAAFGGTYSPNDWCFYVNSLSVNRSCNNGSGADNFNLAVNAGSTDSYRLSDGDTTFGMPVVSLDPGSSNVFSIFNSNLGGDDGGGMDEYASVFGRLPIGQVYAIDSQGSSEGTPGELYSQYTGGSLGNPNSNSSDGFGNSVGSFGYPSLIVPGGAGSDGDAPPSSGFYIQQASNESSSTPSYSSSSTSFSPDLGGPGGIGSLGSLAAFDSAAVEGAPEPGTVGLMIGGLGLMILGLSRRKKA